MLVAFVKPDYSSGGNVHHLGKKRGGSFVAFIHWARGPALRKESAGNLALLVDTRARGARYSTQRFVDPGSGRREGEGREVNLVLVFTAGK